MSRGRSTDTAWSSAGCRGTTDSRTWEKTRVPKSQKAHKTVPVQTTVSQASPFAHETLLQGAVLGPRGALPGEAPLSVDAGEQGEPGQGGVLPVHQALLERTAQLRARPGVLQMQWHRLQTPEDMSPTVAVLLSLQVHSGEDSFDKFRKPIGMFCFLRNYISPKTATVKYFISNMILVRAVQFITNNTKYRLVQWSNRSRNIIW